MGSSSWRRFYFLLSESPPKHTNKNNLMFKSFKTTQKIWIMISEEHWWHHLDHFEMTSAFEEWWCHDVPKKASWPYNNIWHFDFLYLNKQLNFPNPELEESRISAREPRDSQETQIIKQYNCNKRSSMQHLSVASNQIWIDI